MKLSIIIVTYNSLTLITDCIESILKYNDLDPDDLEIIVVDNSSAEEGLKLENYLQEFKPNKIRFFKNKNLGYGHGNNLGISVAKGEFIAIMNPDVRLQEPLFKKAFYNFRDDEVATVGFKQHNKQNNYSFFTSPEHFIPIITHLELKIANKYNKFISKKHYMSGAFVFFRKKHFEEIGLYDDSFFMYFEEPDVSLRFGKIGKKSIFDFTKSYCHLIEVKDDYNITLLDIGSASIELYFRKHNFNLQKYISKRVFELQIHRLVFSITGNKKRVKMANAYINSLRKIL